MGKRPMPRDLGFWRSLSRMRISELLGSWDFWSALLLALLGTIIYVRSQKSVRAHVDVAADFLSIGAALFGVVLAGLAIVAALLGDRYARFLQKAGSASLDVLSQFVVVAGLLIASIVITIMYRASAEVASKNFPVMEQIVLGAAFFLFLWSLFASLQMVKLIFSLAVTNVELSLQSSDEASTTDQQTPGASSTWQRRK
jgi:hypothetical protein